MLNLSSDTNVLKAVSQDNADLSWFASRIEKGRHGIFSEVATITPAIAKRLVESNSDNRRTRPGVIDGIIADIQNDNFILNGEAIIVAKDGSLNDGQHRLLAVIEARKSIQSIIIFGVDRDSRYTVDMGAARTVGDFLGMEGAKYKNDAAAIARLHMLHRKGYYGYGGREKTFLTKQAIRGEYWRFEKQINAALDLMGSDKFARASGISALGTAYVILTRANREASALFFQRLLDGANLKKGDAILALRARLMSSRGERANEKLEAILRHWNAWRLARPVSRAIGNLSKYPKVEG